MGAAEITSKAFFFLSKINGFSKYFYRKKAEPNRKGGKFAEI